jgi:hemimethylated DNA binding protein
MESNENSRSYAISRMITQLQDFQSRWFRVDPWQKWCSTWLSRMSEGAIAFSQPTADDDGGECPAFEVLKYREKDGYFAQSADVRDPRPPDVRLRVGQVVKHKKWGYRGVIIGWDEKAQAPKQWLTQMHANNPHWKDQPNYSILVDTRDRTAPQITYVPQENLETIHLTKILHPNVEDFFENFDGSQYLPRPWLKGLYPKD